MTAPREFPVFGLRFSQLLAAQKAIFYVLSQRRRKRRSKQKQQCNEAPRIGVGYDSHRLVAGRTLHLGGVVVPYERGLVGHSDGDALLHAIGDALCGAAGTSRYRPDVSRYGRRLERCRQPRTSARDLSARGGKRLRGRKYRRGCDRASAENIAVRGAMRAAIAEIVETSVEDVNLRGKNRRKDGRARRRRRHRGSRRLPADAALKSQHSLFNHRKRKALPVRVLAPAAPHRNYGNYEFAGSQLRGQRSNDAAF